MLGRGSLPALRKGRPCGEHAYKQRPYRLARHTRPFGKREAVPRHIVAVGFRHRLRNCCAYRLRLIA